MNNRHNLLNKLIQHQITFSKDNAYTKINQSFIIGKRFKNKYILNYNKNIYSLMLSLRVLNNILLKKGTILFVSNSSKTGVYIKHFAKKYNQPYICSKWISGFLSNFEQVLPDLHKTAKKIKKKNVFSGRKRKTFYRFYKGIKTLRTLPDLIITFDLEKSQKIITEANARNIPVISFSNIDENVSNVTYTIFGQMDSKKVIFLYLKILSSVFSSKNNNEKNK